MLNIDLPSPGISGIPGYPGIPGLKSNPDPGILENKIRWFLGSIMSNKTMISKTCINFLTQDFPKKIPGWNVRLIPSQKVPRTHQSRDENIWLNPSQKILGSRDFAKFRPGLRFMRTLGPGHHLSHQNKHSERATLMLTPRPSMWPRPSVGTRGTLQKAWLFQILATATPPPVNICHRHPSSSFVVLWSSWRVSCHSLFLATKT